MKRPIKVAFLTLASIAFCANGMHPSREKKILQKREEDPWLELFLKVNKKGIQNVQAMFDQNEKSYEKIEKLKREIKEEYQKVEKRNNQILNMEFVMLSNAFRTVPSLTDSDLHVAFSKRTDRVAPQAEEEMKIFFEVMSEKYKFYLKGK